LSNVFPPLALILRYVFEDKKTLRTSGIGISSSGQKIEKELA